MGRARDTAAAIAVAAASPPPGVTPRTLTPTVEGWTRELSHWPRLGEGLAAGGDGAAAGAAVDGGRGDGAARPGEGGLALWDVSPELVRDAEAGGEVSARLMRAARAVNTEVATGDGGGGGGGDGSGGWDTLVASSDAFLARHGYERVDGRYRVTARNTAVVAVVCHGGFGLTWLAHLLGLDPPAVWASFWMAPSSVTTVLFDERTRGWATPRCIGCVREGGWGGQSECMPGTHRPRGGGRGTPRRCHPSCTLVLQSDLMCSSFTYPARCFSLVLATLYDGTPLCPASCCPLSLPLLVSPPPSAPPPPPPAPRRAAQPGRYLPPRGGGPAHPRLQVRKAKRVRRSRAAVGHQGQLSLTRPPARGRAVQRRRWKVERGGGGAGAAFSTPDGDWHTGQRSQLGKRSATLSGRACRGAGGPVRLAW